jgi:hypothetical protein
MAAEHRKSTKAQLAAAIAQGISPARWARAHDVSKNTAYRWARDPKVRAAVETYRRRTIDLAIGVMARNTIRAAEDIGKISRGAESDSVRLRACRAVFSDLMAVCKYTGIEGRVAELEVKMGGNAEPGTSYIGSRALAQRVTGATPPTNGLVKSTGTSG